MRTQLLAALRLLLVLSVVLGVAYPLVVLGVGQAAFGDAANGSQVRSSGRVVGSSLIGQSFAGSEKYFQSRPSAGDYDPRASGASNLALDSSELVKEVEKRRATIAKQDGIARSEVTTDALLASGSGLDPQISPEYAAQQVGRVARERELSRDEVSRLVADHTSGRTLGFLGEPRVNVLELNLALDRASH